MKVLLILGNQLFPTSCFPESHADPKAPGTLIFMREDPELCRHFRYHKQKIVFFLSAMRKYAQSLRSAGFLVHYESLTFSDRSEPFEVALQNFLAAHHAAELAYFEIEDKFLERRIEGIAAEFKSVRVQRLGSPMFLTSRESFASYLTGVRKPFMKSFYERQRKGLKILLDADGGPLGGEWSFDAENRLSLPDDYIPPKIPSYSLDSTDQAVAELVEKNFASHPGSASGLWLPTDRAGALRWLRVFLRERLRDFGPYEDALSKEHPVLNHSVLSPFLNAGLLTPAEVVTEAVESAERSRVPLSSIEGFVRQLIGWREFIRGVYRHYSEKQDTLNFWGHQRTLRPCWYDGTTGIEPLDDVIRKVERYAYAHHIERLMVVGSLMLLLEIDPREGHRWFMEMFIDSSDWVMGPNVYGMALFSDGGVFATKPYICGSNYYRKMGKYGSGDWQEGVDGLYWGFIDRNRGFFLKNPRTSMMVRTFDKINAAKKTRIFHAAQALKERVTGEGEK